MLKLITTAAGAYIPDGINGMAIANSGGSQNSTSSRLIPVVSALSIPFAVQ